MQKMLFHEFASWSRSSLRELAGLAQPEDWNYRMATSEKELPILRNYVVHSFRRAHYQEDVAFSERDGKPVACFNTGLLTPHYEPIFGFFVEQTRDYPQPWFLQGFCRESDYRLMAFQKLPAKASYFDNPAELVYDPTHEFRIHYEHIVNERVDRFPAHLRNDEARRTELLRQAVQHAKFRVEQNYKTAVPQFYWGSRDPKDPGHLQLLLPLCLEDVGRADLALSVDQFGEVYRAATVLTLDMAYNNARLIARPDREWLEPIAAENVEEDYDDGAKSEVQD
jgi:hypothetical protein